MKTLSESELDVIIAKIRQTRENVIGDASLKSDCHFSHMIGNFAQSLKALKDLRQTYGEVKTKRAVSGILREIDDYFIALGRNDKFREYEFTPNLKMFRRTPEGMIGYTEMMREYFVE